ncbi:MAG: hypothetical protein NDJ94_09900 [Vicinamibacteria bacterium]|nr:hypothetical protein [Vicinamibacteria bacterium]
MTRTLRAVLAIARADLRERTRQYPFLWALGFVCWLGWLTSEGTLRVQLGDFRGRLDAAWIGGSLAVTASNLLALVGFWLVRGTIERDRVTGVGQVLATTPLTRGAYLVGKWLSHVAYFGLLLALLALAAVAMTLRNAEAGGLDLVALWLPMALVALPALAFVAGLVVAFEVLPGLRGGFGNVAWFFAWGMLSVASMQLGPVADFSGLALTRDSMRAAIRAEHGVDEPSFTLGGGPRRATRTFAYGGLDWSAERVGLRLSWIGLGALVALAATPFFDRFDPARRRFRVRGPAAAGEGVSVPAVVVVRSAAEAHDLPPATRGWSAGPALVRSELLRVLRGRRAWWWLATAAVFVASFTGADPRGPGALALLWPVLVWSRLGAPDAAVEPLLRACPHPVLRPLLARFVAGVVVGLPFVAARSLGSGPEGWLVAAATLLFPPALAVALGAVAGSPKAFEATWTALWYLALQTPSLDFLGATTTPNPGPFLAAVPVLLLLAGAVRARRQG